MSEFVVRTKVELAEAVNSGAREIVVEGKLAKRLQKRPRLQSLSPVPVLHAATHTQNNSIPVAVIIAAIAASVTLAAIVAVGLPTLIALRKNYEEIDFCVACVARLRLRKKRCRKE